VPFQNRKNKKMPFNLPLIVATAFGLVGDLLGNKAPINSTKLKKSDLTFDDSGAREVSGWKSRGFGYLKNIVCNFK
jgi:hypothetical protein